MSIKMIENNDIFPNHEFIPAQSAQRVLMYVEQDHNGNFSFQPASLVYHDVMNKPKPDAKEEILFKDSLQTFLKWIGLSLPVLACIAGTTYWINSTIDAKSYQNRVEMKADLVAMKQDIMAQTLRTQDSVQRLSDRTDEKFDKVNDSLGDIKSILINQKK